MTRQIDVFIIPLGGVGGIDADPFSANEIPYLSSISSEQVVKFLFNSSSWAQNSVDPRVSEERKINSSTIWEDTQSGYIVIFVPWKKN